MIPDIILRYYRCDHAGSFDWLLACLACRLWSRLSWAWTTSGVWGLLRAIKIPFLRHMSATGSRIVSALVSFRRVVLVCLSPRSSLSRRRCSTAMVGCAIESMKVRMTAFELQASLWEVDFCGFEYSTWCLSEVVSLVWGPAGYASSVVLGGAGALSVFWSTGG